jgi:REP element-mobilizing transposase RayT
MKRSRRRSPQLTLPLPLPRSWGGRRPGAGRKRAGGRPRTPHRTRPPHSATHPVLVTLRACFRPLRSQHVLPTLHLAVAATNRRDPDRFRIVHLTVQYDHLHLIVEAQDKVSLSNGMRSVAIRIARSVNALVVRRGRFWADRWHGRALTSPRQVRTALVYVLANFRKHSRYGLRPGIDPFSSGAWFDGWQTDAVVSGLERQPGRGAERAPPVHDAQRERPGEPGYNARRERSVQPVPEPRRSAPEPRRSGPEPGRNLPEAWHESGPVRPPQTWLAQTGWRRHGLLRLDEAPAGAPRNPGPSRSSR